MHDVQRYTGTHIHTYIQCKGDGTRCTCIHYCLHRQGSNNSDGDCEILQEAPPSKRAKLSTTSKWSIASGIFYHSEFNIQFTCTCIYMIVDNQEWVGCQLGLCPGQEASSTFLDLNFVHPVPEHSSLHISSSK